MHERVDEPFSDESRRGVRIVRSMPVASRRLGLRGVADVVEFHRISETDQLDDGSQLCELTGRDGHWIIVPVEYKRGRPKTDDRDAVQLCAQALALEEMMLVKIHNGCIYYGETRHREDIYLSDELRTRTKWLAQEMRRTLDLGRTPLAEKGKKCSQCSLVEYCQPKWTIRPRNVFAYVKKKLEEDD